MFNSHWSRPVQRLRTT